MKYLWMLLLLTPLVCLGHSKVIGTEPAQHAILERPPKVVTIRFNKAIESHFNKAELWKNGTWTPIYSKVDERLLIISIDSEHEKNYRIRWSVISQDGHRQRGILEFSVK